MTESNNKVVKACDACRLRRKKCENGEDLRQCMRCSKLQLNCTFNQPQRSRGRKKKEQPTRTDVTGDLSSNDSPQIHNATYLFSPDTTNLTTPLTYLHNNTDHERTPYSFDDGGRAPQFVHADSPQHCHTVPDLINNLCRRELLLVILDDYLRYIYPLVPLVHRPALIKDLDQSRDEKDKDFHSLVTGLCGLVVSLLPRRFRAYQKHRFPLRYQTPKEMLDNCHAIIIKNRGPDYFDHISHCKWAIAYTMRLAFYHIGDHNRSRMSDVESMQIARLLSFHKISEYEGLNCIETQLRKKGFWLVFYSYVHNQLQNLRNERLSYIDPHLLEAIKLQDLLPTELDDEEISENTYGVQPTEIPCVTSGFIIHSRVFWAALRSTHTSSGDSIESCLCHRNKHPRDQLLHLKSRLRELKYMLDGISPRLQQWASMTRQSESSDALETIEVQFAIMRANLHSTHIWLQSILLDQLDALLQNKDVVAYHQDSPVYTPTLIWADREELARQLLHVLHNIPHEYLEPNGLNLTEKVRDVAVSLLSCPYPPEHDASKRALEYVRNFTEIMARFELDPVHTSNTQSWVDADRLILSNQQQTDTPNSINTAWS